LYTTPRPPLRPALPIHIISYRCALPSSITPCFTLLISSGDADFLLESAQVTVLRRRGAPGAGLPSIVRWRQLPRRARTTLAVSPHVHRHCAPGWIDGLPEARLALVWTDAVAGADVGEYSAPLLALVRPSTLSSISPTVPQPFLFSPRVHRANLLLLANVFLQSAIDADGRDGGDVCIGWLVGCVSFEFLSPASFGGISFYPVLPSRSLCQKSRQTECQVSVHAFNLHFMNCAVFSDGERQQQCNRICTRYTAPESNTTRVLELDFPDIVNLILIPSAANA
jgi:hypothetical protein